MAINVQGNGTKAASINKADVTYWHWGNEAMR